MMTLVSHDPKIHVAPYFKPLYIRKAIMVLMTPLASHDTSTGTSSITWPKRSCCTSFLSSWPEKCNGAIDNALSITCWCQCHLQLMMTLVSHDPKIHVAPYFKPLYIRKAIMVLMTPLASHDTSTGTSSITWPKRSCCTSFLSSWPEKCNGAVDNALSITCWWCQCQWNHMTKQVCCTSLQLSWSMGCNCAIDYVIHIMWHWNEF